MLDAVLLILREVLEAALIISLLLALSNKLELSYRWSLWALIAGIAGSGLLAHYAYEIADAFDGRGQELLDAALYFAVVVSVVLLGLLILPTLFNAPEENTDAHHLTHTRLLYSLFIVIVSFSLMREGAEIWIYLSAFSHSPEIFSSALIGAVIGAGIGMSLGAIIFYSFSFMPEKFFFPSFIVMIQLWAGGLSMQIAKQLMQIDLLSSGAPLWDSTFLVNEHSWLGELLYALIGYDSRPSLVQGIFYLSTVTPILLALIWHLWRLRAITHEKI
ncbi:FTR1 family protein [Cellvibrio sp. NN19]|uniref:FTR1 family protein n=1 Tax=Cellvibrio chitinivorans TaxID=3102792 RepID=UPI002B404A64|nr:FTR1 family protein [Cellvibrio sp. NN19]